jgi:SAM-dependent methyltransferase
MRDTLKNSSHPQAIHYNKIYAHYATHYYDAESMAYRERFVLDPLFRGLDLNGMVVADLACGGGFNSLAVLNRFPFSHPIGLDLSAKACEDYQRLVGTEAYQVDLTSGQSVGIQADIAMVFGGLHHCVIDLSRTFETIAGLLKPGGLLLMYEPNAGFFLEWVRRLWYRMDRYFDAPTEHALDLEGILQLAGPRFQMYDCLYTGGPAYFLIFNSLVLRVPIKLKRWLARPLFATEAVYNHLPGRAIFPVFLARWTRLADSVTDGVNSPVLTNTYPVLLQSSN